MARRFPRHQNPISYRPAQRHIPLPGRIHNVLLSRGRRLEGLYWPSTAGRGRHRLRRQTQARSDQRRAAIRSRGRRPLRPLWRRLLAYALFVHILEEQDEPSRTALNWIHAHTEPGGRNQSPKIENRKGRPNRCRSPQPQHCKPARWRQTAIKLANRAPGPSPFVGRLRVRQRGKANKRQELVAEGLLEDLAAGKGQGIAPSPIPRTLKRCSCPERSSPSRTQARECSPRLSCRKGEVHPIRRRNTRPNGSGKISWRSALPNRAPQNILNLLLHRTAMPGRANSETLIQVIVQISDRETGHIQNLLGPAPSLRA